MDRIDRLGGRPHPCHPARRPVEVHRTEKDRAKLLALINEGREEAKAPCPRWSGTSPAVYNAAGPMPQSIVRTAKQAFYFAAAAR